MIAVIFEVLPHPEHKGRYLDIAKELKIRLETIEGFISVERFESLGTPGKVLSISFWESEDAIRKWRNEFDHRNAQKTARSKLFKYYRIRIANVFRDYDINSRDQVPEDSLLYHNTST